MVEWWDLLTTIAASPEDFIWLTRIFTEGVQVVPRDVSVESAHLENYPSAKTYQPQLLEYFEKEVANGFMIKVPVSSPPPVRIHPVALIPKVGQPGQWRLITDASSPAGRSINDICPPPPKFSMVSVNDIFSRALPNSWAGSVDVAHAFRNVPISLDFIGHLAVRVGDFYYLELRLPFGWSWAPFIWCSLSDFVQRYVASFGFLLVVYVDDFLCLGRTKKECYDCMVFLLATLTSLGLPVKELKTLWPTQKILFIGFLFDFVAMTVSVHEERRTQILEDITACLSKKVIPRKKFECLVGRLTFVSQVVRGARTFARRLFDALSASPNPHSISISVQVRLDLLWWSKYFTIWNGEGKIHPSVSRPIFPFASDASNIAAGGVSLSAAYCHIWTPAQRNWHINIKELWSVYLGLLTWTPFVVGTNVSIAVDNQVVVSWINSGTARSPQAMKILRKIFWLLAKNDAAVHATWVSSAENLAADAVSRLDFKRLFVETGIYFPWTALPLASPSLFASLTAPSFPLPPFFSHTFHQFLLRIRNSWPLLSTISYLPDMLNPQNVVDTVRGSYLMGFALPTIGLPVRPPSVSLCSSLPGCSKKDMPSPPSVDTSRPYRPSIPPWELRSLSREWNVLRWPYYSEESAAKLRLLLRQSSRSPPRFFSALESASISVPSSIVPSGLASWLVSGDSCVPTTSSQRPLRCSIPHMPFLEVTSISSKMESSSISPALKRINMAKEVFKLPSLESKIRSFVHSLPSKPSGNAYSLALLRLRSPTPTRSS